MKNIKYNDDELTEQLVDFNADGNNDGFYDLSYNSIIKNQTKILNNKKDFDDILGIIECLIFFFERNEDYKKCIELKKFETKINKKNKYTQKFGNI